MRLIFAGTPQVAVPSLEYLAAHHDVVAVLTRAPARQGRKRIVVASPVHQKAEKLGVPVLTAQDLNDPQVCEELKSYHADAAAVVAYGRILPPTILDTTVYGWYNLHFSSLPRWRGAAPVQHAIAAGDTTIGTCVFRVEAGLDTGPIVSQVEHELSPEATSGEVLESLSHLGARQLCETLSALNEGTVQLSEQKGQATYAPSLSTKDSRIDWSQKAETVRNAIRAYTPEPGAWTTLNGQRIKIAPVRILSPKDGASCIQDLSLQPGEIHVESGHAYVGTGDMPVALSQVTPAGKRCMDEADWVRGLHSRCLIFE